MKAVAVILVLILLFSCPVSAEENEVVVSGFMEKSFSSGLNVQDAKVALKLWLDKMYAEQVGRFETTVVSYKSVPEAVTALEQEKLDLLSCNSLDYVRVSRAVSMEVCFLGIVGNQVYENYVLVVDGKKHTDFTSLKGKELLVECATRYEQAQMWLDLTLHEKGLPPSEEFFSNVNRVKKVSHAVLPVFFGKKDVCLTLEEGFNTMSELNPQVKRKLKVLARSPGCLRNVIAWRATYPNKDTQKKVQESAIKLHEDEVGKQVLLLFCLEQGILYKPEYLQSVEKIEDDYLSVFGKAPSYWK